MTKILSGRERAKELLGQYKTRVSDLKSKGVTPKLVVISVGDDPASKVYVGQKEKQSQSIGFDFEWIKLDQEIEETELAGLIETLNGDVKVHGMILQLPLPDHLNEKALLNLISPEKDVDGFHPVNMGKLMANQADLVACTPKGIMDLLLANQIDLEGKHVVIVGRSLIVGLPLHLLFTHANATVTVCHSKTPDLAAYTRQADILVSAVGRPQLIQAHMVKEGAVIVDVGINRLESGKLVGDVDFEGVKDKVSAITPVPGGVGPMTVAMLLGQTLERAINQINHETRGE